MQHQHTQGYAYYQGLFIRTITCCMEEDFLSCLNYSVLYFRYKSTVLETGMNIFEFLDKMFADGRTALAIDMLDICTSFVLLHLYCYVCTVTFVKLHLFVLL